MEIKRADDEESKLEWSWNFNTMQSLQNELIELEDEHLNIELEEIDAMLSLLDKHGLLVVSA